MQSFLIENPTNRIAEEGWLLHRLCAGKPQTTALRGARCGGHSARNGRDGLNIYFPRAAAGSRASEIADDMDGRREPRAAVSWMGLRFK